MLIAIPKTTMDRLLKLTAHQHTQMTLEGIIESCAANNIELEAFADTYELQLAVMEAFHEFSERAKARGETFVNILGRAAGACGNATAWMTYKNPLPGQDVAAEVGTALVDVYSYFLGESIAWVKTPEPPKQPTAPGSNARN